MKHQLSRYKDYVDSEINWLGEMPSHWGIKRVKEVAGINKKTLTEKIPDDYEIEYIDIGSVTYGVKGYATETMSFESAPSRARRIVKKGDTIISTVRTYLKAITAIETDVPNLIVSTGFAVVSPGKNLYPKYSAYWLMSDFIVDRVYALSTGVSYPAVNASVIADLFCFIPSYEEQKAIADYLDTKTSQIDRKIDLLEQKAEKYVDLKQSLINETVTRGLDKTVLMKNSGVEWIGQVPAHWEVKRISDIASQQKNKNIGLREKNLLSLSYGKLKRKDIETSFGLLPESFETYQIVNQGNIILRLTDLQNDWTSLRVGLARERGIITSAYLCLRFSKLINPIFAYYLLHVYDLSKVFYLFGGGLRSTMKFEDIKVLPFVFPSIEEQEAIVNYLESKTTHIENIIAAINFEIEKLKELRKTLINDVVTGKIKVVG